MDRMCALLRSLEAAYRPADEGELRRVDPELSLFAARKVLKALRSDASTPRRHLEARERVAAIHFLRRQTPVGKLVSRNTRALLRRYRKDGRLDLKIADRDVEDVLVRLSQAERDIYDRVEDYISTTYNNASAAKRNAVGFIMTVYRKRLASSFAALARTLEARHVSAGAALLRPEEDVSDDELDEEPMDQDEALGLAGEALVAEERTEIEKLLRDVRRLPTDTKARRLADELRRLRDEGYPQAIVFTQFTDTIDFLRELLVREGRQVACFSGRGGERRATDGSWLPISREDAKRIFRTGEIDILLCTDAAAEGLNFQFCGALVNYDAPWNPMRVEQRIGRIDRLGQRYDRVRIVNMLYEDTVEADTYLALRERIGLFEQFVGRLQPILSKLSGRISRAALARRGDREQVRLSLVQEIRDEASQPPPGGLDLDEAADTDVALGARPPPLFDLDDLDTLFRRPDLLPPGISFRPLHDREYAVSVPGLAKPVRATTSAAFYEDQPESTELWSPGSALFTPPASIASAEESAQAAASLRRILSEPPSNTPA